MESLLHPAMTFVARHARLASSILDRLYLQSKAPSLALLRQIFIILGIPAIILDIMGIGAVAPIVIESIRTPNDLIIID